MNAAAKRDEHRIFGVQMWRVHLAKIFTLKLSNKTSQGDFSTLMILSSSYYYLISASNKNAKKAKSQRYILAIVAEDDNCQGCVGYSCVMCS